MAALRLSISTDDLVRRLRERLRADLSNASVVWKRDNQSLLLNTDSVSARLLDGWLLCALDVQTDQTGRQSLQFVYYLGREGEGDGVQSACTINAPTAGGAQVAAAWGVDLQRVLWDAVLDAVELMVYHAESLAPGRPITLGGFHCSAEALFVDVLVGER